MSKSDSSKLPKKIYVREAEWMPGGLEVMAVNHNLGQEYIRADIAKEREAKLIQEVYVTITSAVDEISRDEATLNLDPKLIAGVYRKAGLEVMAEAMDEMMEQQHIDKASDWLDTQI